MAKNLSLQVKQYRMFHDDSMRSFFRRLSFTPDGSFLLAPGKDVKANETRTLFFSPDGSANQTASVFVAFASVSRVRGDRREHHEHHLHLFQKEHQEVPPSGKKNKKNLRCQPPSAADSTLCFRPIAHLPCPSKATLAVRCCPVYFELRTKKEEGKEGGGLHFTCWT